VRQEFQNAIKSRPLRIRLQPPNCTAWKQALVLQRNFFVGFDPRCESSCYLYHVERRVSRKSLQCNPSQLIHGLAKCMRCQSSFFENSRGHILVTWNPGPYSCDRCHLPGSGGSLSAGSCTTAIQEGFAAEIPSRRAWQGANICANCVGNISGKHWSVQLYTLYKVNFFLWWKGNLRYLYRIYIA